jgi:hypothetical protein
MVQPEEIPVRFRPAFQRYTITTITFTTTITTTITISVETV